MSSTPSAFDRCRECDSQLASDQRYCLICGARRGPLPEPVATRVAEIAGVTAPTRPTPRPASPAPHPSRRTDLLALSRVAAVTVLLMLGVGSVIGAATARGGVLSLGRAIVIAFAPSPAPATPTPVAAVPHGRSGSHGASSGGSAGGGGGGGGTPPITTPPEVTVTAPPSTSTAPSTSTPTTGTGSSPSTPTLPPVGHVWEIVLSDQGFQQAFETPHADPYLARTLVHQGELITQYDAVAGSSLANEVALVSGQGPTQQTIDNCPQYSDIAPGRTGKLGQVLGAGCLYPSTTQTLGLQLQIDGLAWRAYVQGIGDPGQRHPPTTTTTTTSTTSTTTSTTPPTTAPTTSTGTTTTSNPPTTSAPGTTASSTTSSSTATSTSGSGTTTAPLTDTLTASGCPHPAEGATDTATTASAGDGYVTWKNPWVYFHSVVDSSTCAHEDVGLDALDRDLRSERTTPAFSYIAPDPCDDGSDTPCRPGAPAGLAQADRFLQTIVPKIERSPAYRDNGLILITFDQAPQSGPDWSTASCCGQPTFPNLVPLGTTTTSTTSTAPTTMTISTPTTSTTSTTSTASATTPTTTTTVTATVPTSTTSPTTSTTTTSDCTDTTTTTTPTPTTATTSTTSATTTTATTTTPGCQPAISGDPPGGGQVGLLMLSPYVPAGKQDVVDVYNHFALLKSIEKLFGLPALGYAADPQVPTFTPSLFTATRR